MVLVSLLFFVLFSFFFDCFSILVSLMALIGGLALLGGERFGGVFFMDNLSFILLFLRFLVFLYCVFSRFLDYWGSNFFGGFGLSLGLMFFLLLVRFSCFRFLLFYFSFEFLFLLMFIFLLSWGYRPERLQASFYMIFYTIVVSFPFLVYVVMIGGVGVFVFGVFSQVDFY